MLSTKISKALIRGLRLGLLGDGGGGVGGVEEWILRVWGVSRNWGWKRLDSYNRGMGLFDFDWRMMETWKSSKWKDANSGCPFNKMGGPHAASVKEKSAWSIAGCWIRHYCC